MGIHRWPVNSPHKGPVTREIIPFDDVINVLLAHTAGPHTSWMFAIAPEAHTTFSRPAQYNTLLAHTWPCRQRQCRKWSYRDTHMTLSKRNYKGGTFAQLFSLVSLRWRHNRPDSVSKHQPHYCLLNRLFRRRIKETSKLRVTGLCAGNSPGTGEFPAQMASNAENDFIWWSHHVFRYNYDW